MIYLWRFLQDRVSELKLKHCPISVSNSNPFYVIFPSLPFVATDDVNGFGRLTIFDNKTGHYIWDSMDELFTAILKIAKFLGPSVVVPMGSKVLMQHFIQLRLQPLQLQNICCSFAFNSESRMLTVSNCKLVVCPIQQQQRHISTA